MFIIAICLEAQILAPYIALQCVVLMLGKIVFCVFYKSLHYIIQFSYLRHNCSHQLTFKVAVQNLIIV